ncbi:hypothetical protein KAX21_05085 [candidate division WOR-3 bacterium]|nr:hypothetical protein [candidate division WOR-3 bacterium]
MIRKALCHKGRGFVAQALQPVLDIRNSLERLFHIVFLFFCDLLTLRFAGVSVRRKGAFNPHPTLPQSRGRWLILVEMITLL